MELILIAEKEVESDPIPNEFWNLDSTLAQRKTTKTNHHDILDLGIRILKLEGALVKCCRESVLSNLRCVLVLELALPKCNLSGFFRDFGSGGRLVQILTSPKFADSASQKSETGEQSVRQRISELTGVGGYVT